ncbi:MAG TPA: hypothetical protein EYO33_11390 [Phycisphaerales bacterium]|nr:hypothetical protein [Phycisphaerales bacterium]
MAKSYIARQSELQMERSMEKEKAKKLRVPAKVLVVFVRQLSIMFKSGIPAVEALDTLSNQPESEVLGQVVARLSKLIGEGHRLSNAMSYFPGIFDQVFVSMVAIGEESGQLDVSLERLARWKEVGADGEGSPQLSSLHPRPDSGSHLFPLLCGHAQFCQHLRRDESPPSPAHQDHHGYNGCFSESRDLAHYHRRRSGYLWRHSRTVEDGAGPHSNVHFPS